MDVRKHTSAERSGLSAPAAAVIVTLVIVVAAAALILYPTNKQGSAINTSAKSTADGSSTPVGSSCENNPIQSELTSSNSQTITSPTVATYQISSTGTYTKIPSASGSLTQNTLNSASTYLTLPVTQVYNGSAVYPTTVTINSATQPNIIDQQTGLTLASVLCALDTGLSVPANTYQVTGLVFSAPASGRTANTNVESVINSATSQTNSFPAAFPTSAPVTVTVYIQVFSTNTAYGRPVQIPGSQQAPITNYGGLTCNGVASTPSSATASTVSNGLVCYQPTAVVSVNQTQWQGTFPVGSVQLPLRTSGVQSWEVPLTCTGGTNAPDGVSAASGVSASNPAIGCQFSFTVQELIGATGHHADMCILSTDVTQPGYVYQTYTTPAATSFPSAGNGHGLPSGFSGLYPTIDGGSNAPDPQAIDYSCAIATW